MRLQTADTERRELVYSGVRLFVNAYREAISKGLVAIPWEDAPEKGATVVVHLQPPFIPMAFDLIGEVSQRTDAGVVVALQPIASQDRFELDGHADLCEGVITVFADAIMGHIEQGEAWTGHQIAPCSGSIDTSRAAGTSKRELVHVAVNVDDVMQYLHLQRTHLDNRELFVQMTSAPDLRTLVHVHLGLPHLGVEVELRGMVAKSLSDGILIDLAPYPRGTRRTFERYWQLVELAAAEATTELAREHGQAAVRAIRALLPKAGGGIADLVMAEGDIAKATGPLETEAEAAPEPMGEAESPDLVQDVEPEPEPEPEPEREPEREPEPVPDPAGGDTPSIFARRGARGGRLRTHTVPSLGAGAGAKTVASAVAAGTAAAASAPVIPVLLGDGTGMTAVDEPSPRPATQPWDSDPAPAAPPIRTDAATRDRLGPPELVEESPKSVPKMENEHKDISLFKRPGQRNRAARVTPPQGVPPPAAVAPPAAAAAAAPPKSTPEPARVLTPDPPPASEAAEPVVTAPPPEPQPLAPPPPEPAPRRPPVETAPASNDVDEDDLFEDDLSAPLRPAKGSLEERPLLEILGELYRHTATGALRLKGPKRVTTVSFRKGRVCHIAEDPASEETLLGNQFPALGVSKHEVARAVTEATTTKKLIGQGMIASGSIIKSQLKQALIQQLKMRMGGLDGIDTATYEYIDGQGQRREDSPNVDPVKLFFRGRFEFYMGRSKRENAVDSHSVSGSFVRQRNRGRRWISRFGLSLPQQGVWERIESGEVKLGQLYAKLAVDQTTVDATLFTLRDFGCIQFVTKKQEEQTREGIEKRFNEKMDVLRTGSQFDILDVHWTAIDNEIKDGHERCKYAFDPQNIDKPSDLMRKLSREILPAVDEAYELLKGKGERVAYRVSIVSEQHIGHAADHLLEQADMDLFKNDVRAAREKFRRAIELVPQNKKLKRKLNDTFTIAGQAAANSDTTIKHKPASPGLGGDEEE